MSKRMRPSLKDYLRTGEVHLEIVEQAESDMKESKPLPETKTKPKRQKKAATVPSTTTEPQTAPLQEVALPVSENAFLDLLCEADRKIWEPIVRAGTEILFQPFDCVALREEFRTMDRNRFTCYLMEQKYEPLRPARTSVQIKESLVLLAKWDEMGVLTLYRQS